METQSYPTYDLKQNPNSYVKVESKLGNIDLRSNSPTSSYYVCLCDTVRLEGSYGWLYAGLEGKKSPIIDAMEIYKSIDKDQTHHFEILWSAIPASIIHY